MGKITKGILLFLAIFSFSLLGVVTVTGEDNMENEHEEIRERIEEAKEKVEELMELVEQREEECEPYLEEYIKFGVDNSPGEVEKLQKFLNEHEGTDLPVTGFYGEMTMEAVKDFQAKYADDILSPWGIEEPTGFVYKTTQSFINDIKCPGVSVEPPAELVPATPEIVKAQVLGEEEEEEPEMDGEAEEEIEEEVAQEEVEDEEIEEEVDEEEERDEVIREEEREDDAAAWIALIIGALGLGIVVYNIATFNKGKDVKVQ